MTDLSWRDPAGRRHEAVRVRRLYPRLLLVCACGFEVCCDNASTALLAHVAAEGAA